ncbi:OB-fold domain-containing protein [Wenzhouxiangellaceae bacterium CH-27]|uniref:OB-fold domain-containing protein n=2 Tax=Elongatibacter sediminis TaxID=3119006 RepID=A0AAW9RI06_9GAMM
MCDRCKNFCYPAREICPDCWSAELRWVDVPGLGTLLSDSTMYGSINDYFATGLPWRVGTVQLDTGPTVLAHLHKETRVHERVQVIARTDISGQGVLAALPVNASPRNESSATPDALIQDRQLRSLTCDPKGRTVLISDARGELGSAIADALVKAGVKRIHGGGLLNRANGMQPAPLDLMDDGSVHALATKIGHNVDIVIHRVSLLQPGDIIGDSPPNRPDISAAQEELAANLLTFLRLAKTFGPLLRDRPNHVSAPARAWINLISAHALAANSGFGTSAVSHSAAWALSRALRAEFAGTGVKVIDVLYGPLDEDVGRKPDPPGVTPGRVASTILHALQQGLELATAGVYAEETLSRYREDPLAIEREDIRT